MTLWKNLVVALVAAFALAACSSSNDNGDSTSGETPPPEPTAAESQMALIESAQDGLDAALSGLDADEPTAGQIEAVTAAVSLLADALAGANDLSPNETEDARDDLADAREAARAAQVTLNTGMATDLRIMMQMEDIAAAQDALSDALDGEEISDIDAANAAYGDLKSAIEAGDDLTDAEKASAMSDLNMADVEIANAELAMYENAAMADGATLQQMLAAYEGKLTAAQRLASATAASADDRDKANQAIGAAETKIAELNEDIQDAQNVASDKMRLENNKKAMRVAEAINAHTPNSPPNEPSEFTSPDTALTAAEGTNYGVERISGDATFTLTQTVAAATKKRYETATAPSAGPGWSGKKFTHTDQSGKRPVTEMAAIYTDIEMAEDEAWKDYFEGAADDNTGLVALSSRTGADSDTIVRISSGILPRAPSGSDANEIRTIALETKTTPTRISGSYYGVSGTYGCEARTLCTVSRDGDGVLTYVGLTFTPTLTGAYDLDGDDATVFAKYAKRDMDYTYFGYWMESDENRDGTLDHDIKTFHNGSQAAEVALDALVGTAKYYGAAAGVYVKKDGAADSLVVTSGQFTADAELTAHFGGPAVAGKDHFTVTGEISAFMDGSADLGFDDLTLGVAKMTTSGEIGSVASPLNNEHNIGILGETDGGGTSGNWEGQFYGKTNVFTSVETDDYPMNVSGEFNGHFVNGHVAGAFGAEYDE